MKTKANIIRVENSQIRGEFSVYNNKAEFLFSCTEKETYKYFALKHGLALIDNTKKERN